MCVPQINWTEFLTAMFVDVPNVTLDLTKDKILVEDDEYLQKLAVLLADTPRHTLGTDGKNAPAGNGLCYLGNGIKLTWLFRIELSLWWELVDLLAPYTTSEMRQLRRRYQEIASGTSGAATRYG